MESIPKSETETSPERLLSTVERVFKEAPLVYKSHVTCEDWLMVIDGLKAGTDIFFPGDTYDNDEYQLFKSLLEAEGLRITNLKNTQRESGILFRYGIVYNPQALAEQTATAKLTQPYNTEDDLQTWFDRCSADGSKPDVLWGLVYSFPASAIRDFTNRNSNNGITWVYRLLEGVGFIQRNESSRLGNEVYWYYNSPHADILDREERKRDFFSNIKKHPRMITIMNSQELKDSKSEWNKRLPNLIKKK